MKKVFIVLPLVAALSACGTFETSTKVDLKAPEFGDSHSTGKEVKYPDWFTEKEKDDALYAVASEYSKDFQFAVDKSMLSAKRELASNFSSHVSAMLKDYAAEVGELDSTVIREIDRTTKMVVAQVNLIGVQRTKYRVQYEKDGYRAFVKLRYAADESNKLLLAEVKKNRQLNAKLQASKSFKELEAEVSRVQ
ncbi:MAG: hypothetical protein RLZZ264_582 [Bacillota bacterium]|jgi:hypothetical protein